MAEPSATRGGDAQETRDYAPFHKVNYTYIYTYVLLKLIVLFGQQKHVHTGTESLQRNGHPPNATVSPPRNSRPCEVILKPTIIPYGHALILY